MSMKQHAVNRLKMEPICEKLKTWGEYVTIPYNISMPSQTEPSFLIRTWKYLFLTVAINEELSWSRTIFHPAYIRIGHISKMSLQPKWAIAWRTQ